ncbi:MAG: hypothetical protein ACM3ML_03870 [Micromonosporaceae bacterium]
MRLRKLQGAESQQATLNGQKVVLVNYPDGTRLYVANTGPAYPLRLDEHWSEEGEHLDFSEYGVQFHITAPKGALDMGSF